jgi:DNA-binding SARP family transcriptional activator
MNVRVDILGPMVLAADGRSGKIPKKARALLGFLAAHNGQPVAREVLADLLWPYQQSEQARHSLRNCLLEVRKSVGPDVLVSDFTNCRYAGAADIDEFETLAASQDIDELERFAGVYRGELLDGLEIDSTPWEEWLGPERQRIRDLASAALFRLAKLASAAGDHRTAIANARRVIQIEPYCEVAHRLLMHALAAAGRSPEALRHYSVLERVLKDELSIRPDAETAALRQRIVDRVKPAPPLSRGQDSGSEQGLPVAETGAAPCSSQGQAQPDPRPAIQVASAALQEVPKQLQAIADRAIEETMLAALEDRLEDLEDLPRQLQAVIAAALRIKHTLERVLLDVAKSPARERQAA